MARAEAQQLSVTCLNRQQFSAKSSMHIAVEADPEWLRKGAGGPPVGSPPTLAHTAATSNNSLVKVSNLTKNGMTTEFIAGPSGPTNPRLVVAI